MSLVPRLGVRVPAADERGRHPHHGHDAERGLAGARRRGAARDAAHAAEVPRGQGRAHRAGAPRGRHRRRGAQPVRDVRDHEAGERVAHRPHEGADRRRDARRARAAPGRRLQLQPADQGPRRGVDLGHPRPGRRQDLRRRPAASCTSKLERGRSASSTRRAARATSTSTAPAAPQHIVADVDREATSRYGVSVRDVEDTLESAYGGKLATDDVGGRAQGRRARQAAGRRPRATPRRSGGSRSRPATRGCRCRRWPSVHVDSGRTQINREQGRRFLALKCNIEGRDMGSFVDEAQARVRARA